MGTLGDFERIWSLFEQPAKEDASKAALSGTRSDSNDQEHPNDDTQVAFKLRNSCCSKPTLNILERYGANNGSSLEDASLGGNAPDQTLPTGSVALPDLSSGRRKNLIRELTAPSRSRKAAPLQAYINNAPLQTMSESELRPSTSTQAQQFKEKSVRSRRAGYLSEPEKYAFNGGPSSANGLRLSASKKRKLISLLCEHFQSDSRYLRGSTLPLRPARPPQDSAIHVFVDLSNILIGFQETSKRWPSRRRAHSTLHRQPFSFHNFSIVLERGRPAARRVVVGSDEVAQVEEAKALGYEANILRKVASPARSAPEPGLLSHGRPKSIRSFEQGVDEILHLKIAQSLLDTASPAVIVLASGDAAEAEFSDGFPEMLERALKRGWKAELVAFKSNISSLYRSRAWTQRWPLQFKVIELDEYAAHLYLA